MLQRDVAPGIHRIEDSVVNWYLVEDGDRLLVVDCGVPTSWRSLRAAVADVGRRLDDVEAIVLTHAHYDHVGFAERARRELGVPVWVHEGDRALTRHPAFFRTERLPLAYLRFPGMLRSVASMTGHRGLFARPVKEVRTYSSAAGALTGVPAAPSVVFTPGHTDGHCSLHFPERDALIAGDAIVTYDPYTGRSGPRLVARAATKDSAQALRSLDAIAATDASTVLVGHGDPWTEGAQSAAARAREAGAA